MTGGANISISVVIPCYNGGAYLAAAIESALGQTYPPLEVIVVDDGSTDNSAEVAERFGGPVRLLRQSNQGESVARNQGIQAAHGTHIALLDADDMVETTAYARMASALADCPDGVACMGCTSFTNDPAEPHNVTYPAADAFLPKIFTANLGECHCWLTPKVAIDEAGGFCEPLKYFEDWDLWWRVGMQGRQFVPVQFAGALYRHHSQSQMATARLTDRAIGHATIKQRMASALLQRSKLLTLHGETMFWACWAALDQARRAGASWKDLAPLASVLNRLVAEGPPGLRSSRFAKLLRLLGPRGAHACYRITHRGATWE